MDMTRERPCSASRQLDCMHVVSDGKDIGGESRSSR